MIIPKVHAGAALDDGKIDYATYSIASLLDARGNIQRDRYPQNYENLQAEIATRPQLATHQDTPGQPSAEAISDAAIGVAIVDVVLAVVSVLP
ncbi:MAG: hypothetical protein IPP41_05840 [Rhodocyclaceae bacterium]|nr:hypothetical protein [Rhodocyclaceae bacterium]